MTIIKLRRGHSDWWSAVNPILDNGEQGYETDTGKFKIGDDESRWSELSYFIPEEAIRQAIYTAIAGAGGGSDGGLALYVHINSSNPHPVYDDGPSLTLLYENAKV